MNTMDKNILLAKGFPRFARTGTPRSLKIDIAFQVLAGYRSARIQGGDALHASRNTLHVTMPNMRAEIAAAS